MSDDWFDLTPDERAVFAMGFEAGQEHERTYARVAAFGAIRRAAEIMRWHERKAEELRYMNPHGLNAAEAAAIRRAIRAAIGSDKA